MYRLLTYLSTDQKRCELYGVPASDLSVSRLKLFCSASEIMLIELCTYIFFRQNTAVILCCCCFVVATNVTAAWLSLTF